MKKDTAILIIATLTLAELTLLLILGYRYYQSVQPQLANLESAGSGLSNILGLLTGKKATTS
jgi:hypothetical protein